MARMIIDLSAEVLSDGADSKRVEHVPVRGVSGRDDGAVGMDCIIVVKLVAEVLGQLGEEARVDESSGSGIDARFTL